LGGNASTTRKRRTAAWWQSFRHSHRLELADQRPILGPEAAGQPENQQSQAMGALDPLLSAIIGSFVAGRIRGAKN